MFLTFFNFYLNVFYIYVPAYTAGQMSFNQLVNDNIIGVQRQLLTSKYNTKYRQRYIYQEIAYT